MTKNTAADWIATDMDACRKDVVRLGLDGAVEYQMELIVDRSAMGDERWSDITESEMRSALVELSESSNG